MIAEFFSFLSFFHIYNKTNKQKRIELETLTKEKENIDKMLMKQKDLFAMGRRE
jgi:hypothetical protein